MANSPNKITKSTSLADLLATPISDGTFADVLQTTKTDAAGQEAAASQISENAGQLIANLWDDAAIRVVQLYDRSTKVWLVADATERDALGSDDDLAENDLAFQVDTLGLNYCVSVDGGAASTWAGIAATGNVAGPGASTDNAVARFDGTGGATLQNSVVLISDSGAITGVASIAVSGTVDGRDVSADGAALDSHVASVANPHATLLSQTLAAGNDTNGYNLVVSNGDKIAGEDGGHVQFAAVTGVIQLTEAELSGDLAISGAARVGAYVEITERASSPGSTAGVARVWVKNATPTELWFTDDLGNASQLATVSTSGLSAVLGLGNTSGPNNLVMTDSAEIVGEAGSSSVGGDLALVGGAGDGAANAGGSVTVTGGTGAESGAGGAVVLAGGFGGATSGAGGAVTVKGGDATAGASAGGLATLAGGQPSGAGAPGGVALVAAGAVSGNVVGGSVTIDAGDGAGTGAGGSVTVTAGECGLTASEGGEAALNGGSGNSNGNGGLVRIQGGPGGSLGGSGGSALVLGGAATNASASGGGVEITAGSGGSGAATGGSVTITSGDGGGSSGNSGGISIVTGAVTSGTRGAITLDASDVIVANPTYHSVRGSTSRGSSNTLIYRWSSVVDAVGSGITYTDSAANGGSWAISKAGIYSVSCSIDVGHNGYVAIKRAASVSNTFDATDIQVAVEALTGYTVHLSWTGYCASGDDIWIATSAATNPTGTPVNNNRVTITRVR